MNLPAESDKLMKLATDYESFPRYFPHLIKSVKVVDKNDLETTTEEVFTLSRFFDHEIILKSIHKKIDTNQLETRVTEGPFKGSNMNIKYEKTDTGTRITVNGDLKLGLKYKILGTVIKKEYKQFLMGLLYKMNTEALE
jgi:ribosome-associated toxin RatA of RatAB toxin-antitoxin module